MDLDLSLPGADLIAAGLAARGRGERTVEALLVEIGNPRLRRLGLDLPAQSTQSSQPELDLYRTLGAKHPRDTHSRYNALIRRLISFEQALERSLSRRAESRL